MYLDYFGIMQIKGLNGEVELLNHLSFTCEVACSILSRVFSSMSLEYVLCVLWFPTTEKLTVWFR